MDILRNLFSKASTRGLFAFAFPQAPAGLQNTEYLRAYRGWVYACVKRKADSTATMELTLQRKQNDEWKEVTSGPALKVLDVLAHVNPFTTSDGMYRAISSFLDLTGNAFVYVAYNGKKEPSELWLLDPRKVEVILSDTDYIAGWEYTNPKGKKIRLETWEVIPFQDFNPLNPVKGFGPTEAGALPIDSDRYTAEWKRNFFANSAVPSLVLKTKQNLTDEQYQRLIEGWLARFKGVQNAHKPAVLEGDMDVTMLNSSLKDMDMGSQRREDRDEILAIFGVPKALLGIVEDVNRANVEGSEIIFAKYTMAPRLRFLATTFSEFYLPMWGLNPAEYRLYANDCVPRNDEMDLKRKESGLKNGYYTINEIRAEEGLKPIEGGDEAYIPANLIPLDAETRGQLPAIAPGNADDKPKPGAKKTLTKAQKAADTLVAGRVEFLTETIAKYQTVFQLAFEEKRVAILRTLEQKGFTPAKKKDIEEQANELVRFLFTDWDDWIGVLVNPTRDALQASMDLGGRQALAQVDLNANFDQLDPNVMDWLNQHALEHATSVSGTVKEELISRVMAGVEQGLGADEIAASFNEFFDTQTQWRALRIARTEAITGYAEGAMAGYRQSGLVSKKKWLTAGDASVDVECLMNEAQGAVPLEDNFASGHSAPPVHPNCKCVLQPVISDNG